MRPTKLADFHQRMRRTPHGVYRLIGSDGSKGVPIFFSSLLATKCHTHTPDTKPVGEICLLCDLFVSPLCVREWVGVRSEGERTVRVCEFSFVRGQWSSCNVVGHDSKTMQRTTRCVRHALRARQLPDVVVSTFFVFLVLKFSPPR